MASKKVENLKGSGDAGIWACYGYPEDNYIAAVSYHDPDYDTDGMYVITFHCGEMPAFDSEVFATAETCEARMRELEPDLRKWKSS